MTPDIHHPLLPRIPLHCPALILGSPGRWLHAMDDDGPAAKLTDRTILLVEDELLLAMEIQMSIEDEGGTVIGPIGWLRDALDVAETSIDTIDGAVLDIDLHGEEVFPLAEKLYEEHIPFLFHTGHGRREDLKDRFSGVPVCIKPVMTDKLIENLERIIDS